MTQFISIRRRMLKDRGRPMTLRRLLTVNPATVTDVTVQGLLVMFRPDQVGNGDIAQGDAQVSILNDEINAVGWPGPPRVRDQIVLDGRTWTVRGSTPLWEGTVCIGHSLFIRGG